MAAVRDRVESLQSATAELAKKYAGLPYCNRPAAMEALEKHTNDYAGSPFDKAMQVFNNKLQEVKADFLIKNDPRDAGFEALNTVLKDIHKNLQSKEPMNWAEEWKKVDKKINEFNNAIGTANDASKPKKANIRQANIRQANNQKANEIAIQLDALANNLKKTIALQQVQYLTNKFEKKKVTLRTAMYDAERQAQGFSSRPSFRPILGGNGELKGLYELDNGKGTVSIDKDAQYQGSEKNSTQIKRMIVDTLMEKGVTTINIYQGDLDKKDNYGRPIWKKGDHKKLAKNYISTINVQKERNADRVFALSGELKMTQEGKIDATTDLTLNKLKNKFVITHTGGGPAQPGDPNKRELLYIDKEGNVKHLTKAGDSDKAIKKVLSRGGLDRFQSVETLINKYFQPHNEKGWPDGLRRGDFLTNDQSKKLNVLVKQQFKTYGIQGELEFDANNKVKGDASNLKGEDGCYIITHTQKESGKNSKLYFIDKEGTATPLPLHPDEIRDVVVGDNLRPDRYIGSYASVMNDSRYSRGKLKPGETITTPPTIREYYPFSADQIKQIEKIKEERISSHGVVRDGKFSGQDQNGLVSNNISALATELQGAYDNKQLTLKEVKEIMCRAQDANQMTQTSLTPQPYHRLSAGEMKEHKLSAGEPTEVAKLSAGDKKEVKLDNKLGTSPIGVEVKNDQQVMVAEDVKEEKSGDENYPTLVADAKKEANNESELIISNEDSDNENEDSDNENEDSDNKNTPSL